MASLPDHKTYNILLLGPTKAGKSTFINAFANYFTYESFDEALKVNEPIHLIPSTNEYTFKDFTSIYVENYGINRMDIANEVLHRESSATQKPRVYSFNTSKIKFNFIDVPGTANTNGLFQDIENTKLFSAILRTFTEIHAIFILVKSCENLFYADFKYCLNQTLTFFHANAVENIMFVTTFSRGNDYSPGYLPEVLKDYVADLTKHNRITIELSKNTIFCVDNEAYKFQCCWNKSEKYREEYGSLVDNFRKSWDHSKKAITRILNHIINNANNYDVSLSTKIAQARNFIHYEVASLASIETLLHSTTHEIKYTKRESFIEDLLKIDSKIQNVDYYQETIFDNIFKERKSIDFEHFIPNDETRDEVSVNQIFNILPFSQHTASVYCCFQKNCNVKEKEIYKIIIEEPMTHQEAEMFFDSKVKALQKDQVLITKAIQKLSLYLKQNAILLYDESFAEIIQLEIRYENRTKNSHIYKAYLIWAGVSKSSEIKTSDANKSREIK